MDQKFKILSIDGGGIRGIIPAKILADMEDRLIQEKGENARLYEYFDLICGTSTGGIIALAISMGIPAKKILELYETKAKLIFPDKWLLHLIKRGTLYDREQLTLALKDAFGMKDDKFSLRMKDCKTRVCIPAFEYSEGEIRIFKTPHNPRLERDLHIPVVDVALMTSAAPIYFEPYSFKYVNIGGCSENEFKEVIDGGILANNPALIGLTEAIYCENKEIKDCELLSIGTGEVVFKNASGRKRLGLRYWTRLIHRDLSKSLRLYELMSSAQSAYINNTINMMYKGVGGGEDFRFNYVRLQPHLDRVIDLSATDEESLKYLHKLGQKYYQSHSDRLWAFLQDKVTPYK